MRRVLAMLDPVDRIVHRDRRHGIKPAGVWRADVLRTDGLKRMLDPACYGILRVSWPRQKADREGRSAVSDGRYCCVVCFHGWF
jgi:hypothetical protein